MITLISATDDHPVVLGATLPDTHVLYYRRYLDGMHAGRNWLHGALTPEQDARRVVCHASRHAPMPTFQAVVLPHAALEMVAWLTGWKAGTDVPGAVECDACHRRIVPDLDAVHHCRLADTRLCAPQCGDACTGPEHALNCRDAA